MTANNSKYYLGYLYKLVDEKKNTYHRSISKKLVVTHYCALAEEIETNPKAPNLKLVMDSGLQSIKIILAKLH